MGLEDVTFPLAKLNYTNSLVCMRNLGPNYTHKQVEATGTSTNIPNNEECKSEKQHLISDTPCKIIIVPIGFGGF